MLALAFTLLVALYVLGPDLIARWILGFAAPRKVVVQTRAEELTRSVLWAFGPLVLALLWTHRVGAWHSANWADLRLVYSGLYSTTDFEHSESAWYASLQALLWWNLHTLWRLYLIVGVASTLIDLTIWYYGPLRNRLPFQWLKTLLAVLVLPRVAEWHVLLSPMLLPSRRLQLHADVLAKGGTVYQGRVADKVLNTDGSLQSLTLAEPKRFLRDVYKADESSGRLGSKASYWRGIPGNLFVVLGSDISNINIRYVAKGKPGVAAQQAVRDLLRAQPSSTQAVQQAAKALKDSG